MRTIHEIKTEKKLILVGAGPGDPDLITVKGINALKRAKVILYDALVHPQLLSYAPKECKKVFVGKRAGKHSLNQKEINRLIVESAQEHGLVVRLKGGDPFVFGRAQEEIEQARLHGIPTEVVPGISSATSLTTLQHVPLTARGIAQGFWVLTGTKADGSLSQDLALAARSNSTVVILMGVKKLRQIVRTYKELGFHDKPVALIQNGSLPSEKVALGTIHSIEEEVARVGIGSPAIIVIGDVVRFHREFTTSDLVQRLSSLTTQN